MTEFKPFPTVAATFPESSHCSGTMRLVFRGDGSVGAMQDSGHRVGFRGGEYSVHLEFKVTDGVVTETGKYDSIKRSHNWTDAPPTFAKAIREAVTALVEAAWNPTVDRLGLEADVAQDLNRLERNRQDLAAQMAEIEAQITAARARLARSRAAQDPEDLA